MFKKSLLIMLFMALMMPWTANAQSYCSPVFSQGQNNYGIYIKSFETEGGDTDINNSNTGFTSGGYADYYDSHSASIEVGQTLGFTATPGGTANACGYAIWVDWNQDYEFSSDELVASTATIKTNWTGDFLIASTTDPGDYRMRIVMQYGTTPSSACASATYGEGEDYKLTVMAVPSCHKPTGFTVADITSETATATWNGGEGSAWNLQYKNVHESKWNQVNGLTEATYTMANLDPATSYEVQVQADCGSNGTSDWTNTIIFTTTCATEDMCELSYALQAKLYTYSEENYYYGWYGSGIRVYDANSDELLAFWTVPQHTENGAVTGTLAVCENREIRFEWYCINASNDNLLVDSYAIYDVNGEVIASGSGAMASAVDYTMNCTIATCFTPTGFYVNDVDTREATLHWTENGSATQWIVAYKISTETKFTEKTVTENPYTLTDLLPDTEYIVKVRPDCEGEKWTNTETFTTLIACYAPTEMHAEDVTAYSADVKWTSDAGNYQFRYGIHTGTQESLLYDDGIKTNNIGAAGSFYWAVMFPAGTYTGNYLSKVSNYDIEEMTGNLMIYNDGATAPEKLLATKAIEFTGIGGFVDFNFDQMIEINPSKNLWIVFQQTGGADYPAAGCADPGDVNARWASLNGTSWDDLANLGVTGVGWMIRANVETISISGTIHSCTENTYPLTGLSPEMTYAAQVRTVCGGEDGVSKWATTMFTTPASCTTPEGLVIVGEVTARDATFEWTVEDGATYQYCTAENPAPGYTPGNSDFVNETTDNTVTLTHYFTPDTDNMFYLRKKCSVKEFSDIVSVAFHTDVACHAPTTPTVSDITAYTAEVNWTGESDNYDIRHGLYPDASIAQEWLTYNVTQSHCYGSSTVSTRTWGVKYLGSEVTGNCLTKVEVYEAIGNTGPYNSGGTTTINVYSGGDDAPGELLYTETVPMVVTTSGLVTITLASPVIIPSDENLWITLTETGTFTLSCGPCTDDNNRWIYNGTTWITWATGVNNDLGWIINGYMETLDYDEIAWVDRTSTSNSCILKGLTPETPYIVQVRSVCGGEDGESAWKGRYFETTPSCVAPEDLEASDIKHNSATLSWTGGSGDYDVRYGIYEEGCSSPEWLTYNVTHKSNYGANSVSTRTRGVKYLASEITGNVLTSIRFYVNLTYNTGGNIIVKVYSGGDDAPGTLLYTETITDLITGVQTVRLAEPVNIVSGENLWITFTETGTYTMSCGTCTEDNNRWYYTGGEWTVWQTGSTNNLGWIIEGYMETLDLDQINWNTYACTATALTITGLVPESFYIAQVRSDCGSDQSEWISTYFTTKHGFVFVYDGNWNDGSNWYLGTVPANGSNVVIQANAIIPSGYEAIANEIELDGGSIIIKDGGQLIHPNAVTATLQRNITGYGTNPNVADGWYLIASPVNNLSTSVVTTAPYDLYMYNEPNAYWYSNTGAAAPFNTLSRGIGYLYANANDMTLCFEGEMIGTNTTNIMVDLDYTGALDDDVRGFNLVGNPFTRNLVDGDITIQEEGNPNAYYITEGGSNLEARILTETPIKPGQGFMIQVAGENHKLIINPSAKDVDDNRGYIKIVAGNEDRYDNAFIQIGNGNTLRKLNIGYSNTVYVIADGYDYAAARVEELAGTMPVHFNAVKEGEYTITVNAKNIEASTLLLFDNFKNETIDLLETPTYSFKSSADDEDNRFKLIFDFNNNNYNGVDDNYVNGNFAYQNGDELFISGDGTLQVFDVMGRFVMSKEIHGSESVSVSAFETGVYMLRFVGENVMTQKIVIR